MKKTLIIATVLTLVLALSISAMAAGARPRRGCTGGVCGNRGGAGCSFVDADGDGVCDHCTAAGCARQGRQCGAGRQGCRFGG